MIKEVEEIERCIAAYQGGKLRAGDVPLGAKIVKGIENVFVAHFATKGFEISFAPHKDEKDALVMVSLKPIASSTLPEPSSIEPQAEAPVAEAEKEG